MEVSRSLNQGMQARVRCIHRCCTHQAALMVPLDVPNSEVRAALVGVHEVDLKRSHEVGGHDEVCNRQEGLKACRLHHSGKAMLREDGGVGAREQ